MTSCFAPVAGFTTSMGVPFTISVCTASSVHTSTHSRRSSAFKPAQLHSARATIMLSEGIFLGLYFYGWKQLSPRVHVACGAVVALSCLRSAVFVTLVNAWMHSRCCFDDPLRAMATRFAFHEVVHGCLAAYLSTAFA